MRYLFFFALLLPACIHQTPTTRNENSLRLQTAIETYTERTKRLDAYEAPYFNIEEDLSKFGDFGSDDYWKRAESSLIEALDHLKAVDPTKLSPSERLTYRLFKDDMETSLEAFKFPFRYLQVDQMSNRLKSFVDSANQSLTKFPFDSVAHYDAFVERAKGFPAYVDREIHNMRAGMEKGITLSCAIVDRVPLTYKDGLETKAEKNPFYQPIQFLPSTFPEAEKKRLTTTFKTLITETLQPAYRKFDSFLKTEYRTGCQKSFGIGGLPNGADWYRYLIRANTNVKMEPKDIHDLGLREVARINNEMRQIEKQLGFKGNLNAFRKALIADPKSYFKTAEEMFQAFEAAKAATNKRISDFFSLIPQSDYKIVRTSNPEDASGSYLLPSELHPYGRFIVNTINLKSVPKFDVTTLLLHEAVPGHHFQLALLFEAKDRLSEYQRKVYQSNAFVEGWALYAEYLGNEMGLLQDPMQRFGHLNDEMLRAVRLVVDSGIHAMNWSQAKANAYMRENLASDPKDIQNEVNRYSVMPGQALGYKIGQLKILELRRKAERELESKFDIRGFHSAVIGNGTLSLEVLEAQVEHWIQSIQMRESRNF